MPNPTLPSESVQAWERERSGPIQDSPRSPGAAAHTDTRTIAALIIKERKNNVRPTDLLEKIMPCLAFLP